MIRKILFLLISALILSNSIFSQIKKEAVEFKYIDDDAHYISIIGDFNSWDNSSHPLTKVGEEWIVYIGLDPGYYVYKIFIDGKEISDPNNDWKISDGKGGFNSVILVGDPPRPQRKVNKVVLRKSLLPIPILGKDSSLVELYYSAWELLWNNLDRNPNILESSKYYISDGSTNGINQWNSSFLTIPLLYSNGVFPIMSNIDNFYSLQNEDGFIAGSFSINHGLLKSNEFGDINPPLFAWIEWKHYVITGDRQRLRRVFPKLVKYYRWIDENLRDKEEYGLFTNTPIGSAMPNLPRPHVGNSVYIDLSAQQALSALYLSKIAKAINRKRDFNVFNLKYSEIKSRIFDYCWNWNDNFFYDMREDKRISGVKHLGAFWTLISEVCPENQVAYFIEYLSNKSEFNKGHVFPSISSSDNNFTSEGKGFNGSIFPTLNYMIIKGLEKYGFNNLAYQASLEHLRNLYKVFLSPEINEDRISFKELYGDGYHSLWESYSPINNAPSTDLVGVSYSKQDFPASAVSPIALLIENVIGLHFNKLENKVTWNISRDDKIGIKRIKFGNQYLSLISEPTVNGRDFEIKCSNKINLIINWDDKTYKKVINQGINSFSITE